MTTWIIANALAGGGRSRQRAEQVALALQQAGRKVELHYTHEKGHGLTLAQQAVEAGAPFLFACGGDGTIHETLPALVGSSTALGLLPFGTANDLARALGVPRQLKGAIHYALTGRVAPMDLGRIGDHYFATVAAFGFDAEISHAMSRGQVPLSGTAGYLLQTLRHLGHYRAPHVILRGDFGEIEQRVFLVASGNTRSYGGDMRITPHADPHDGLLDVCITDELSTWEALALLPRLFSGQHIRHPAVRIERTSYLEIGCQEQRVVYADGEFAGQTPLTLHCEAAALQVIFPSV